MKPTVIGITGGIGCGKSRVCSQFNAFGIDTYDADGRAKKLYFSEPELLKEVQINFPEAFEGENLNLRLLGNIVFFDFQKLQLLNKIIAPFMFKDFNSWLQQDFYNPKLVLIESAILLDSELKKICTEIVYVYAPESIRIDRTLKRDNRTLEQVKKIIEIQRKPEDFISECFYVINNSGDYYRLEKQILRLHDIFNGENSYI